MDKLIEQVDTLMYDIKNDTTRSRLTDLTTCLVELSKIHGEAKQELIRKKNEYDRELLMKKEQRKQELERLQNLEVEKDPKFKRTKISNVEIEHYAELELMSLKREQEEPSTVVAYLDVYIKSIYERIVDLRFQDNLNKNLSFNGQ